MTAIITDALRAAIVLLSATRETFAAEVMLREYDDALDKLRAALVAADHASMAQEIERLRAEDVDAPVDFHIWNDTTHHDLVRETERIVLRRVTETNTHPQPPSAQAEPVAWRITDGEGGYDYRDDPPEDWQVAWVARWGRKHEPLYTRPPSAQADAIEALRMALDALSCTGDPDDPGHRCGHCDEYVDRNSVVRKLIRAVLAAQGGADA